MNLFEKKSLESGSEPQNTMVTGCCIKLWIPSGLRTTSKPATAQGIQLIWLWTLNWEGFSCCLCWGDGPVLPWWILVIYKLVVVVMRICARWIPSIFKFLRKKMMLHALLLIPFCPWVGLRSINWFFSPCGNDWWAIGQNHGSNYVPLKWTPQNSGGWVLLSIILPQQQDFPEPLCACWI